jgi:receptor protein-tyrosine kinase
MEIQVLWHILSQRWRVVAIVTLFAVVAALAWSMAGPAKYLAEGRVIISTSGSLGTAADAYSSEQVSIARAPTYAALLKGPEVASRASKKLNGDISAQTIRDSVDARISSRLPMVVVSAKSNSANDAVQMVAGAEQGLQEYVTEIERPGRDGSLTSVTLSADPPVVVRDSHPVRNALLAALVGFLLGLLLAIYRDRTDPVVKSPGQLDGVGFAYRGTVRTSDDAAKLTASFRRVAVTLALPEHADLSRLLVVGVDRDSTTEFVVRGLAAGLASCGRVVTVVDGLQGGDARGRAGLSDVLAGTADWQACVRATETENLTEMGLGTSADKLDAIVIDGSNLRSELPASDPRERILIAGPSIVHSSVAIALTAIADGALVVVHQGVSTTADVAEAKRTLAAMDVPSAGMLLVVGDTRTERPQSRSRKNARSVVDDADEATVAIATVTPKRKDSKPAAKVRLSSSTATRR